MHSPRLKNVKPGAPYPRIEFRKPSSRRSHDLTMASSFLVAALLSRHAVAIFSLEVNRVIADAAFVLLKDEGGRTSARLRRFNLAPLSGWSNPIGTTSWGTPPAIP
jgi:hypothetical protein